MVGTKGCQMFNTPVFGLEEERGLVDKFIADTYHFPIQSTPV